MGLGVRAQKAGPRLASLLGPAHGHRQHRRRNIDAESLARRTNAPREFQGRLTTSAADVDHTLSGEGGEGVHRAPAQRFDLPIEVLLQGRPGLAGGGVPVVDLIGVG